jgi:hypothetical protein
MKLFSKLNSNYRQVQSSEEISFLFPEGVEHNCQLWNSQSKEQFRVKLYRLGDRFKILLPLEYKSETIFFIHCPKLSFAMKFKTLEEKTEGEEKIVMASLLKWVRPEYRGMIRNKVAKTKAFVFIETASDQRVISGDVRNFNFYGCQIQFHMQYEETLRRLDPNKIPIKIKSANEITYYGNLCYMVNQGDNVLIGIHFPDGCSAKVQFDNWS